LISADCRKIFLKLGELFEACEVFRKFKSMLVYWEATCVVNMHAELKNSKTIQQKYLINVN
jgi:hypothetical protein